MAADWNSKVPENFVSVTFVKPLVTSLRGRTSMTSGFFTESASGLGSVLVRRTRHLFGSLVVWPGRFTWVTGVRAVFCSLIPARFAVTISA